MAETTNENSGMLTESIDRRSALKKAAAAGAIAWTAPMIISSTAHAASTVCTPKCAHPQVQLEAEAIDSCEENIPGEVPANVNKIILFKLKLPAGSTCDCDEAPPEVILGKVPVQWDKLSPNAATCSFTQFQYQGVNTPSQGANSFALYKVAGGGADASGWYVPNGPLCVAIKCLDADGTPIYRVCTVTICFKYQPSQAPCNTTYVVETRTGSISCSISCNPCP
jgi:hypothetical protein